MKFIQHKFSGIYVCWLCQLRHQLKDMLFLFAFDVHLAEFTSMLWVIILPEYKSLTHMGLCYTALYFDSWSDSISPSPGANPWLCNWQKTTPPSRASSMVYCWCDVRGCSSFTNSSLLIDTPIWPKDFKLWFVCPKESILLFYCSVFVCLVHWSLLRLFCFLNSGFLTAILLYRPASPLSVCWHFFYISSVIQWCLEQSVFCHAKWWLWWNCSLHR